MRCHLRVASFDKPHSRYSRRSEVSGGHRSMNLHDQRWGFGSFADDLFTGRADVLSRAATTLRSVESKASSGRTVSLVQPWVRTSVRT
jgi:hypothetical protein